MNARGFKLSEVVQLKPAVTGTARNDGTSQGALAIDQPQGPLRFAARRSLEGRHLVGNGHLDPEFLCLGIGPGHQLHAADAGRKTEIIFDPRGGAAWPPKARQSITSTDRPSEPA